MRRTVSSLASLLLFLSTLSLLLNIQSVGASGTIYIRSDGSIDPVTSDILTTDNATYVFVNNIYEGIMIQRSNIILDGKGYTLKGSRIGAGILLSGGSNITIKNMTISNFLLGISIESPRNNIIGNNIAGIMSGININSASNSISNNTISGNTGKAIYCYWGSATTIIGNDIENGIYLRGNGNKVYGNRITGSGIACDGSSNNIIQRNLIFACPYAGILLRSITYSTPPEYPDNNLIVENEIIHCATGVGLDEAKNTTLWHNNLINNTRQVAGGQATIWDHDYPSGGNYWSDYTGTDLYSGPFQNESGSDGIGDTPYLIYANDRYPLVKRYNLTFWQTQRLHPHAQFTSTHHSSRPAVILNASASMPGWNGTHLSSLKEYTWQFGDGNITSTTSFSITHIYPSPGNYTISLTVTDHEGFNGSSVRQFTIWMPTTISVQMNIHSTPIGFKVDINGTLQDCYGTVLKNQRINARYYFEGTDTWTPTISDYTDMLGKYAFEWIPSATGYFTISISWHGNSTHQWASSMVYYSLTTHEEYFVAIESNNPISDSSFDVPNRILTFTSTRQYKADIFTRVSIPKTLVPDINKVTIFINGLKTSYNSKLLQDSQVFEFKYTNGVHDEIEVQLSLSEIGFLGLDLWEWVIALSVGAAVTIVASILIHRRRKDEAT